VALGKDLALPFGRPDSLARQQACRKPCLTACFATTPALGPEGESVGDPTEAAPACVAAEFGRHRPRPMPSATTPARRDSVRLRDTSTCHPAKAAAHPCQGSAGGGFCTHACASLDALRRGRSTSMVPPWKGAVTASWRAGLMAWPRLAPPRRETSLDASTTSPRARLPRAAGMLDRPVLRPAGRGACHQRGSP